MATANKIFFNNLTNNLTYSFYIHLLNLFHYAIFSFPLQKWLKVILRVQMSSLNNPAKFFLKLLNAKKQTNEKQTNKQKP